jgi:hypothetical protein
MLKDGASVDGRPPDRLVESGGLGRGPHCGDLRNLRARDSLTETTLYKLGSGAVSPCATLLVLLTVLIPSRTKDFCTKSVCRFSQRVAFGLGSEVRHDVTHPAAQDRLSVATRRIHAPVLSPTFLTWLFLYWLTGCFALLLQCVSCLFQLVSVFFRA